MKVGALALDMVESLVPIKLKDTYLGVEFLIHSINFHDKYTQVSIVTGSGFGYQNLAGLGYTTKISYIFGW